MPGPSKPRRRKQRRRAARAPERKHGYNPTPVQERLGALPLIPANLRKVRRK